MSGGQQILWNELYGKTSIQASGFRPGDFSVDGKEDAREYDDSERDADGWATRTE